MKDTRKEIPKKESGKNEFKKNRQPNTKVESDTGKRPAKDKSPLPPNPNKVDNH